MASGTRKRSPNFSEIEIQTLLKEVEKNKSVLFSKLSSTTTNSAKKRAWESICAKVNSCNSTGHVRSVEEIRKKWTTYMSETKKKAAKHRKELKRTGGGPPPRDLTPFEETVIGIIGDTPIDGIPGGLDLAEEPEEPPAHEAESAGPSHITDSGSSCPGKDVECAPSTSNLSSRTKRSGDVYGEELLKIQELLDIEREKLQVQKELLEIKKAELVIKQQRHQVCLSSMGSHLQTRNKLS